MPLAKTCCFAILAAAVGPQTSPAAPASVVASVAVSFPTGKTTYHIGEEIPVVLEFRGTADKDYFFSTGVGCGPFGRPPSSEKVTVTPSDGIEDPLADPFPPSELGGVGWSCAGSWHPLDGTPFIVQASINDAVRFMRAGTYSVVVMSTRLGRYSLQPAPGLTSAPVELTIVPDDEGWATTEVARAVALIDGGVLADVRHGSAILRYLDTEAATMALVEHYDVIEPVDGAIDTALILSPYRASIVAGMEARVDAGARLAPSFFTTLARVRVRLDLPPDVKDFATRNARLRAIQAEYDARWRAAIARRPPTAATVGAELRRVADASPELKQHILDDLDQHPAEAAAAFVALPSDLQSVLLQPARGWMDINRPWILPALRKTYAGWTRHPSGYLPAGDLALTHLYELAPDEGRRLILDEITTGQHGSGYDALAILPDAQLPELDATFRAQYSTGRPSNLAAGLRDRGTAAWLMARYGSANLAPFVTGLLAQRGQECVVEGALLAYLFKYAPAPAVERLDPNLDHALRGACAIPLSAVAVHYWDDRVESAAITELGDADIRRVADAADVLGRHGSHAAKQPLFDRLTTWSAEWQGRAAELESLARRPNAPFPAAQSIENSAVSALLGNPRFALTKDDLAHIRSLCVTDGCRTNVDARSGGIK